MSGRSTSVTITSHSRMVGLALQAAEELAKDGIEAEVIDIHRGQLPDPRQEHFLLSRIFAYRSQNRGKTATAMRASCQFR